MRNKAPELQNISPSLPGGNDFLDATTLNVIMTEIKKKSKVYNYKSTLRGFTVYRIKLLLVMQKYLTLKMGL